MALGKCKEDACSVKNVFNLLRRPSRAMKATWSRVIAIFFMLILLGPIVSTASTNKDSAASGLVENSIPSDITYFNATQLFADIFSETSQYNIGNLTKDLTENYPSRTWDEGGPSQNLMDAWQWADEVLRNNTDDELTFQQVTEYQSLLAIKSGIAPAPRPAIVIAGVIDSEDSPGTNDAGAGVAAVLEIARVLHNYTFACNIYYVLLNGMHIDRHYDLGGRAFVQWLEENNIRTLTGIAFDRILFHRAGYLYAFKISIRSSSATGLYHDEDWIPQFLSLASADFGNGYLQQVHDLGIAQRSLAYEMWQVGRPAMHVAQGYQYDPLSSTASDTWDNPDYSFEKAAELAASTASVVAYIGLLGTGVAAERSKSGALSQGNSDLLRTIVSKKGFLNATITWDGSATLLTSIFDISNGTVLYNRTESDNLIVMKYLVQEFGSYAVNITNLGAPLTNYSLTITAHEDVDGDTLTDLEELGIGTSPYLRDSDSDSLDDDFEIIIGTNPISNDTDGDGASDYDEFIWGSSLLSNDTDGDNIGDGMEAILGTNPTSPDSDNDGLDDYLEVYVLGTNPISSDTDLDGLEDGFEYEMGLNPLSPDTDGDSLSDMFEVLNQISPFTRDTDGDGWSDAYEVEYCMSPTNPDTDGDGIPDGIDWDPREHWISVVSPVGLLSVIMLAIVYSFLKFRVYRRE